ncbi:MAG: hypothetical protein PHR35_19780, partial [Kiritimatiellae bacterium]|nr:hypothetical protein [Kiritimatiellia bacterium]
MKTHDNRRRGCLARLAGVAALVASASAPCLRGAEPWELDRIFWLDMNWNDVRGGQRQTDQFDAWTAAGTARGKPLSKAAVAVLSPGRFGKDFRTGATDQAVEWPAEGCVNAAAGAISLFVAGTNWDVSLPGREPLVVLDGPQGSLALEKNKPGMLAVVLNGAVVVETPLADAQRYRHLVVNFGVERGKKTGEIALYVDRRFVGSKQGVRLPGGYARLVVGHLGPGPGVNKLLDNVAVYRRPLAPGEVTKIYHLEGRYELPKLVTAPFAAQPPKIDGIFDAGEWDWAAEIRGFMDVQTGKPWNVEDAVRLQYDKDKL